MRSENSAPEGKDRRRDQRFDTSLPVNVRFLPDGTPLRGSAVEVGPNGMRITTPIPLIEASYIHISFEAASNNTHCEGRVVWTRPGKTPTIYESGIDIQRWGGGMPGQDAMNTVAQLQPKTDRRKKAR